MRANSAAITAIITKPVSTAPPNSLSCQFGLLFLFSIPFLPAQKAEPSVNSSGAARGPQRRHFCHAYAGRPSLLAEVIGTGTASQRTPASPADSAPELDVLGRCLRHGR